MNIDGIMYSFGNIAHRKMRSFLTVLSILIGVMAIFAIVSFGLGIKNYMDVLAEEAGADKLYIQARGIGAPGTDDNFFISRDEIDFVEKINGVNEITGMYMSPAEIVFNKERKYYFLSGFDMSKIDFAMESFGIEILKGRQLKKEEKGKVVLGYLYQFENRIFKKGVKLGDKVEVNDNKLEVVGFYEEVGNPADDGNIYVSQEQFEGIFPDKKDKFGWVMVSSQKGVDPEELADKVEDKLRKYKDQEEGKEDFFVQTFADALATFGVIINVLNGILGLIALISLVVASVNIMNTMYTAVIERTQEIGIMKSIGARNSDILFIFIFESGFLGVVGGIIGVILGYIISSTGGAIAAASGFSFLKPIFPMYLILGCIFFAFFVGTIAGVLPAVQASKLKPVDALRYE